MNRKKVTIDPSDKDFGTLCVCAVRYCLGRQTYMPGLVQGIIKPYLSKLDLNTLFVMERDIADAENFGGYGDERIDKPGWLLFLGEIRAEVDRRCADERKIVLGIYRHFKGNEYEVIAVSEHTETSERMVVYKQVGSSTKIWCRPYAMFAEKVDDRKYPDAKQIYRFELVKAFDS